MALIVEDGTGKSDAESYISEVDADTYFTDIGTPSAWSTATTVIKESALRVATQYLDVVYGLRWKGTRTNISQRLAWPRSSVLDYDDNIFDSNAMPRQLKEACAESATRHISETNGLLPDLESDGSIKSERVKVGPIEEEIRYAGAKNPLKQFTIVKNLIKDLITASGTVERG